MTDVPFTVKPGAPGPWRSVQEALRQQHDEARIAVDEAIAKRKEKGIPLDDRADWRASVGDLLDGMEGVKERTAVVALLEKAHAIANGGLTPVEPHQPVAALDGAEVRLRALSKADVMTMTGALASTAKGEDIADIVRGNVESFAVMRAFVAKSLVGVRGAQAEEGEIAEDNLTPDDARMGAVLDALDVAGLLPAIFNVARRYNTLDPKARRAFGLQPPAISDRSSAPPAPSSDARSLDVRAAPLGPTSPTAIACAPTAAPGATSSITSSSLLPSSFAVSLETSPG